MNDEIKSGKEILEEFFDSVEKIPGVDRDIASTLNQLYRDNKMTATNLSNALLKLREDAGNDKD